MSSHKNLDRILKSFCAAVKNFFFVFLSKERHPQKKTRTRYTNAPVVKINKNTDNKKTHPKKWDDTFLYYHESKWEKRCFYF